MLNALGCIAMGSVSDWPILQQATEMLRQFQAPAAQIIAAGDPELVARIKPYKAELAARVERDAKALQSRLQGS